MRDSWTRGLLAVVAVLLLAHLLKDGPVDAQSAPGELGEYHLVTMSDDSIILVRRVGDRLDGLGQLRQGKDHRRFLWTSGGTFETGQQRSQ